MLNKKWPDCYYLHHDRDWWSEAHSDRVVNLCQAQSVVLYFSSFEAGIADAIPSFKWQKIFIKIGIFEIELFD